MSMLTYHRSLQHLHVSLGVVSLALVLGACGDDSGGSGGAGASSSATGGGDATTGSTTAGSTTTGSTTTGSTTTGSTTTGSTTTGAGGSGGGTTTGSGGATGSGGSGTGGAAGTCLLAEAPTCTTMEMPAGAPLVTGVVGELPAVSGGGDVPPGTYVLTRQIVAQGGTPSTQRIAVFSDGNCFTGIEAKEGQPELRLSGTATYDGETATTNIMCPIELSVSPAYQVLAPVGGKVAYATINGTDYREWLQL